MKKYTVEQFGDIHGKDTFEDFRGALEFVEQVARQLAIECYGGEVDRWIADGGFPWCDPEDNRITITGPNGEVVWHFSGWHWDADEFELPQGKLLGHEKSLYEISNY